MNKGVEVVSKNAEALMLFGTKIYESLVFVLPVSVALSILIKYFDSIINISLKP